MAQKIKNAMRSYFSQGTSTSRKDNEVLVFDTQAEYDQYMLENEGDDSACVAGPEFRMATSLEELFRS